MELLKQKLDQYQARLGLETLPSQVEQGSYDWHKMRLGVITASKAHILLMGKTTQTYRSYLAELAAEIATKAPQDPISGKAIEWGNTNEPLAIQAYEFTYGRPVTRLPFLFKDDSLRCGCSPDGMTELGGLEIKCPFNTTNHILTITDGRVKKEYIAQVQFSMWVSGVNFWEFGSYDPRMLKENLSIKGMERSEEYMQNFDEAVPEFCRELDQMLEVCGFEFGDQWK